MSDHKIPKIIYESMLREVTKVVVGKTDIIKMLTVALFSEGHVLLEGVPGVAKTLLAKAFAKSLGLSFRRIQFTPDMLPSDIVGTFVFNQKIQDFVFREGPIFANVILADEINRTAPKTQSALLEVMQERQVTVEGFTKKVNSPFIVIATQNPVEHEGTYPLPEAQLDRFMFRLIIDYPTHEESVKILELASLNVDLNSISSVITADDVLNAQSVVKSVYVDSDIMHYITAIIEYTRNHKEVMLGGSPRASIHLLNASKALAAIYGRDYVIPDDVKESAFHVLNHRILLKPEFLIEVKSFDDPFHYNKLRTIISDAINHVEPPR
ncbi:MAG: MoxR family ATPase [Nitrososphaerota archaeon]|nr:MoxR family ATPase [Nitrososphaerales archaeon]MDW8045114.1 MoxR family ATPase [Nitrososphaerota archaeon]